MVKTLYDFGLEVQKIRAAIDSINVSGIQNARLIAYAFDKCNTLIEAINAAASTNMTPPSHQNGDVGEGVEMNGEQNSGTASCD